MAITKEFYVELDLKQATGNRDFTLVEGDTGNIIHVTLTDDGTAVDLSDCRVLAVFTKPTGSSMQDSAIEDGGVTIGGADGNEVTIELFAGSFGTGTNACELQIYSGTERDVLVTSAAFNFYCRNGIIDDDTIISTDEYPQLTSLIRQVQAIEDGVLTPLDLDDAMSATSENPVKNSVVKAALDEKAGVSHTHAVTEVTDFPATMPPSPHAHTVAEIAGFPSAMPPSAHTHVKADVTDFAHTHDASDVTGLATLLWEGSWSSGSVEVPRSADYTVFAVTNTSGMIAVVMRVNDTIVGGSLNFTGSSSEPRQTGYVFKASVSGDTWTMQATQYMIHIPSGNHNAGTGIIGSPATKIYGLL